MRGRQLGKHAESATMLSLLKHHPAKTQTAKTSRTSREYFHARSHICFHAPSPHNFYLAVLNPANGPGFPKENDGPDPPPGTPGKGGQDQNLKIVLRTARLTHPETSQEHDCLLNLRARPTRTPAGYPSACSGRGTREPECPGKPGCPPGVS